MLTFIKIFEGITTECQISSSQERNKKEAFRKIQTMVYQNELDKQQDKYSSNRRLQVKFLLNSYIQVYILYSVLCKCVCARVGTQKSTTQKRRFFGFQ